MLAINTTSVPTIATRAQPTRRERVGCALAARSLRVRCVGCALVAIVGTLVVMNTSQDDKRLQPTSTMFNQARQEVRRMIPCVVVLSRPQNSQSVSMWSLIELSILQ